MIRSFLGGKSVIASLALLSPLCSSFAAAEQTVAHPVRIGVSAALTGPAATYGTDVKNAVEFAAKKLGARRFKILVEDDHCNPKDALTIANKFTAVDHVEAVIGPTCSGAALAVAPIYSRAKTLQLVPNATASKISEVADYTFAANPGNNSIAEALAKYLCQPSLKLGVIAEQTEFAQDLKALFLKNCSAKTVVEDYLPNSTEFATPFAKLRAQQVDKLVLIPQTEATLSTLVQELEKQKWSVPRFTFYFPGSPTFLSLAGESANGIIYSDWPQAKDMLNEEGLKLFEEFISKTPVQTIDANFAFSFESVRAIGEALRSRSDPRTFMTQTEFSGVFGQWKFGELRRLSGVTAVIKKIEGGKIVVLPKSN